MADIRIKDLPLATGGTAPVGTDAVAIDGLTTRRTTITALGNVAVPIASQATAEAGVNATERMVPLTVKQSIASEVGVTLASAANGALASTALQPGEAATPAQGALADSALQAEDIGTAAGTVAAGDDTRIVNAVARNSDLAITQSVTSATSSIPPGGFGGLFLTNAFASNVWTYLKSTADATSGPRFLASFASRVLGGHGNGPDQQRSVFWRLAEKINWSNNTALSGEIDVDYIQMRQGNLDDVGGILIDGGKVFDVGSTGSITDIEASATRFNFAGTTTSKVRAIVGFQEGLGGALNGNGASLYAENETNANNIGLAIVNNTAAFAHAVAGYLSRNHLDRWFSIRWDGNPIIELGSATDSMKFRYASSAILVKDETEAVNLYVFQKDGTFRPNDGIVVKAGSSKFSKYIKQSSSVDFGIIPGNNTATVDVSVTGAAVGDSVLVTMSADYANDKVIYMGRVLSANLVRISGHNIGTASTADLPTQTAIIEVTS